MHYKDEISATKTLLYITNLLLNVKHIKIENKDFKNIKSITNIKAKLDGFIDGNVVFSYKKIYNKNDEISHLINYKGEIIDIIKAPCDCWIIGGPERDFVNCNEIIYIIQPV